MSREQSIYDFTSYKSYLQARVGAKSARRGLKSALAKALSCQPTYISQILNRNADLSLEQAAAVNGFLGHAKEESHFFMLMVQRDRAGNREVRQYFDQQIQEILDRRLSLTGRLGTQNALSETHKTEFYSSWHYAAVHMALTVPHLRTKEALTQYLQLPLKRVAQILEFLVGAGLARQSGEHYFSESSLLRIANDTPHIVKHHTNWRVKAIESLDREESHDFHYSAVVSLSQSDMRALKNRILENIKDYVATIRDSREEEVGVLCIDLFKLGG